MSYRFSLHFLIQFDWFYIISTDRGLPEMAKQFLTTHFPAAIRGHRTQAQRMVKKSGFLFSVYCEKIKSPLSKRRVRSGPAAFL
jgi:hypothetical protein